MKSINSMIAQTNQIKVDKYLVDGCMRCKYGGTPQCKVNNWKEELVMLRQIVIDCGLTEELKWGVPCYTYNEKNVVIVSAFKDFCSLNFFKGSLIEDTNNILVKAGENSQSGRLIKFTKPEDIANQIDVLQTYILRAIEIEKLGLKVQFAKNPEPVPDELLDKFDELPTFKNAFYALTPGRQRGYIIYFSQPKQSLTRISRIDKCVQKIFSGLGLND